MKNWKLIVVIVERGKADKLVKLARESGASGATIYYARGTGTPELQKLFSVQVDAMKEVIMIVADDENAPKILKVVSEAARLNDAGAGIAFTVNIDNVIGMDYFNIEKQ